MASEVPKITSNNRFLTIYIPEAQTLKDKKITLKENHDWKVEADGNVKEHHSLGRSVLRFLESAEGLFRFGQLGERLPKFVNAARAEYGLSSLAPLDTCASKSLASWTWLTTIPRVITMTPGTIDVVKEASDGLKDSALNRSQKLYRFEKASREVTDTAAMYAHAAGNVASLFPGMTAFNASCSRFADNTTFAHDILSLKMNCENYWHARSVDLASATRTIKETVEGTKRTTLVAIAKDIVALAGFLVAGSLMVKAVMLAALPLAATVLAVIRKMSEEAMTFKPINFLDNRSVTWVTA